MSHKYNLPPLPDGFEYRLDLASAATTRLLKMRPVHRWFYFPHSYSPELVETILDSWQLQTGETLLDPFVGAGTTLLVAKQLGLNALGIDLSPLAVRASNAKIATYDRRKLEEGLNAVLTKVEKGQARPVASNKRLKRAFSAAEYIILYRLKQGIAQLDESAAEFFRLALLSTAKQFSRAVADGGWYRWVQKPDSSDLILAEFEDAARDMIDELDHEPAPIDVCCRAILDDARAAHRLVDRQYDALITSPPYPNRHDYSRVYHIELLLLDYSEEDIFNIRHRSLRSHVEAKAPASDLILGEDTYEIPKALAKQLSFLPEDSDPRIPQMLIGYFRDLYYSLSSVALKLRGRSNMAFVVGNVRHAGVMFKVDEILADVGQQVGLTWKGTWVIRLRGNSAQQMGRYGREPSRESIVFFQVDNP